MTERYHQGLGGQIIRPKSVPDNDNATLVPIGRRSRLGGLLNYYSLASSSGMSQSPLNS